jgi:cell division protein FtsA
MEKGGVNDLDSVMRSVKLALNQAEGLADCEVASVYLSISGHHISSQNEKGMVSIDSVEVSQDDVDAVVHTARSVKIPNERRILHVLPQDFIVDELEGIRSPVGMSGMRMEANVHLVTCASDWAKNIIKCVERVGVDVDDLVFSGIASAEAVLTQDEKDLGVCLVDIGAGTTDIAIYADGALRHCQVLPVAGNQVTNDIAKLFRTPSSHAEQIKVQYACAQSTMVNQEDSIEVPSVGGRPARTMARQTLSEVVEPRYHELFEMVADVLRSSGLEDQVAAGVVLTGGSAQIQGAESAAEACLGMPVRLAQPQPLKGLNDYIREPSYATAVGLLHYGAARIADKSQDKQPQQGFGHLVSRMQSWFKGNF